MSNTNGKIEAMIAEHYDYAVNLAEQFCSRRGIEDTDEFVSRAGEILVVEGRKWKEDKGQKFRTFIHQRITWALLRLCKAEMQRQEVFTDVYGDASEPGEETRFEVLDMDDFVDEEEPDPMDLAAEMEDIETLYRELDRVLKDERIVLLALYVQGHTIEEAAEVLGMSATSIRRSRDSGLRKLRARMAA